MLTIKSRSKERRESCKRKEKEGWLNTEARASRAFHLSAQVILESRTREKKRLSFPLSFRAKSEEKRGCIVPYWLRRRSSSGPVLARWATWEILSVAGWIRKMGDRCSGSFSCVGGKNTTLSGWIYRDSSLVIIENDNYNWQSRFEDQDIYIYIYYVWWIHVEDLSMRAESDSFLRSSEETKGWKLDAVKLDRLILDARRMIKRLSSPVLLCFNTVSISREADKSRCDERDIDTGTRKLVQNVRVNAMWRDTG